MLENLNAWGGKLFLAVLVGAVGYYGVNTLIDYRPPTRSQIEKMDSRQNPYTRKAMQETDRRLAEIQRDINDRMQQNADMMNQIMNRN